MSNGQIEKIARELNLTAKQVLTTSTLLDDGATVPFIARYRKEATGSLDEIAITTIRDRIGQLRELDKRREAILKSLEERGQLSDELKEKILVAETMAVLEDIYLPYRPKRRTRATIAREKGLEPLAQRIFTQDDTDPFAAAEASLVAERGVDSIGDALGGARDIIAEWVNEDQNARKKIRELFVAKGIFRTKIITGKEDEGVKYKDYFDWQESVSTAPSHRILAMRRGEKEGFLSLRVFPPEEEALAILESLFVKGEGAASQHVKIAVQDCYKRLLSISMETEIRLETKKRADEEAIRVFAENLRQLLLASPLGQKNVLAIDPGFRTGCKVVCMDRQGKLLHTDTIYPHQSGENLSEAAVKIISLCNKFEVETIAIGNGTAGRETEAFIKTLDLDKKILVVMVNESGASVYSASDVAREEFPDQDVTVRGAVSIGRRLMDPLAELVKIDPKSIGVGQYQHDVDQTSLRKSLEDVVVSCVNAVGVDVNTASNELLTYVSGLGPQLAHNIVAYRNENGPFEKRTDLKKVHRLGPKAFEQSAGFLRIPNGIHPLDASAVHPESYPVVEQMAKSMKCTVVELMKKPEIRSKIELQQFVSDTTGMPTLVDILQELDKPGRDPRDPYETMVFSEDVKSIEDLQPGMRLPGIITNITAFGAFVDVGAHQDGLVHISQLSDSYVKNPADVVKVQQKVTVTVLEVDLPRKRIALSMRTKSNPSDTERNRPRSSPPPAQRSNFKNSPFSAILKKTDAKERDQSK